MKSFVLLLALLLACTLIEAQSEANCPSICPAVFSPVCGETRKNGRLVRCKFSNGCQMGVSACVNCLKWSETSLSECKATADICRSLGGFQTQAGRK
ncbi:greglin [Drosophila obscura]|uniref:greglin n=1 Tax=Drosophila obscura TaxID=7282 RepID=UPI001BB27754|nr:greglin [Drosophila obscura]